MKHNSTLRLNSRVHTVVGICSGHFHYRLLNYFSRNLNMINFEPNLIFLTTFDQYFLCLTIVVLHQSKVIRVRYALGDDGPFKGVSKRPPQNVRHFIETRQTQAILSLRRMRLVD